MLESADLIRRFHAGDTAVFEQFLDDHKDNVYTLCLRHCGDINAAEEATEQIFIAAHRALYRLDPSTSLGQWVMQVAIGFLLDMEQPESIEHPPEDHSSAIVNNVLQELDSPFRFAVILRDILKLTEAEISEVLNLPLGTIRSRIHRGRLTMARSLARESEA